MNQRVCRGQLTRVFRVGYKVLSTFYVLKAPTMKRPTKNIVHGEGETYQQEGCYKSLKRRSRAKLGARSRGEHCRVGNASVRQSLVLLLSVWEDAPLVAPWSEGLACEKYFIEYGFPHDEWSTFFPSWAEICRKPFNVSPTVRQRILLGWKTILMLFEFLLFAYLLRGIRASGVALKGRNDDCLKERVVFSLRRL